MALLALADLPPTDDGRRRPSSRRWPSRRTPTTAGFPTPPPPPRRRTASHFLKAVAADEASRPTKLLAVVGRRRRALRPRRAGRVGRRGARRAAPTPTRRSPTRSSAGLAKGWPAASRPKLDDAAEKALGAARCRGSPPERRGAARPARRRAGAASSSTRPAAEIAKALLAQVDDATAEAEDRVAAAGELIGYQPADTDAGARRCSTWSPRRRPPELARRPARRRSGRARRRTSAGLILERLPGLTPDRAVGRPSACCSAGPTGRGRCSTRSTRARCS